MSSKIWYLIPLGLLACASDKEMEPALTPASGATAELSWNARVAVSEIARVECDREQRCGNIGARGAYTTHPACTEVRARTARERLYSCRAGIDQDGVNSCLQALRVTGCTSRIREPKQIDECEASDLCRDRGDRI